jgi:hypothetical protein
MPGHAASRCPTTRRKSATPPTETERPRRCRDSWARAAANASTTSADNTSLTLARCARPKRTTRSNNSPTPSCSHSTCTRGSDQSPDCGRSDCLLRMTFWMVSRAATVHGGATGPVPQQVPKGRGIVVAPAHAHGGPVPQVAGQDAAKQLPGGQAVEQPVLIGHGDVVPAFAGHHPKAHWQKRAGRKGLIHLGSSVVLESVQWGVARGPSDHLDQRLGWAGRQTRSASRPARRGVGRCRTLAARRRPPRSGLGSRPAAAIRPDPSRCTDGAVPRRASVAGIDYAPIAQTPLAP